MMQATNFEFRNRWWLFWAIYCASFSLFAFDHVRAGERLAGRLAAGAEWPKSLALHVVFGTAGAIMLAAAVVRTWGSAYLGRKVVHDEALHSEALHADGPYRHVRNPLYLGNVLMSVALGFFAPLMGWLLMMIGIPLFCHRLIRREEAALEAEQGERYRAFLRAVPRWWPSIRARIPAGGGTPGWSSGLAAEAFFWPFAFGIAGFALSLNILWFYGGLAASPLLGWPIGLITWKRGRAAAPVPEK